MSRPTVRRAAIRIAAAGGLLLVLGVWIRCGPLPDGLLDQTAFKSTVVLARDGEVLYEARSADGTRGERIAAGEIPGVVAAATLAAEDRRFRSHVGLDPVAIARAAWRNLRARAIVEGGSTISQQVAQLLLARRAGDAPRRGGWRAQLREAIVALRLEHRLDKDEILALYLNLAPYGNQIAGIRRAAHAYFGSAEPALTPAEAAFLAALPQQPTRYNPWRDRAAATGRQRRILRTMAAEGWLEPTAFRAALEERLTLRHDGGEMLAPHFVERVLSEAPGPAARIDTTLDATLQRAAQGIIAARRKDLEAHGAANVAVVVLDNRRGEWLVWEGSGNYADAARGGAIDGVISPRQPGSALKPFTYAAAFERDAHPGTVLADVPSQFPTIEPGILYSPRNYDGRFRGPMRARDALAGSENVPAVALASAVGVPGVARLLRSAGLTTLDRNADHYGLGLTLGNAEVRLDELVAAYAAIARGGVAVQPRKVRAEGDGTAADAGASPRVMSTRTAFWIADILSDPEARSYSFGRGGALEFPFTVAAKTGTSQAYHDNWAIAFTPEVTAGVWVGNFDRRPLRASSGVTGAGPILHDVLLAAVSRVRGVLPVGEFAPVVAPTTDVRRATLCAVSGMAAGAACVRRVTEWVPVEAAWHDCTWHHQTERGLVTIWPEAYRHWARGEGLLDDDRTVAAARGSSPGVSSPAEPGLAAAPRPAALGIAAPLAGATYLIDPTLRPEFQTLPLQARGADAGAPLEWLVNGRTVGTSEGGRTLRWPLVRGRHVITVRDGSGRRAETTIDVR